MKYLSFIFTILCSSLFWTACQQGKKSPQENTGVTNAQLENVDKNTKPFNTTQMPGGSLSRDSFVAFKVYLSDGKIVADSTRGEMVYGKLNLGPKNSNFRIETKDANGRILGTVYSENVFTYRSCDEGGLTVSTLNKGWIDIFVPYAATIETIDFVENDKSIQQISMKTVRANRDKIKRKK